jgi:hypothetical protein
MYDPPAYLSAITVAGPAAVAALTCSVLYGGAVRAGRGRRRAALLTGAAAVVLGGWLASTAVIAGHGWYRTLPWFPVAVTGYLGLLLALRRIPVVARAAPLVAWRLAQDTSRRAGLWFNAFGMTDLVVALTLGALTGFGLLNVTPSSALIAELPLAPIPTATVPLLFALHITSTGGRGPGCAAGVRARCCYGARRGQGVADVAARFPGRFLRLGAGGCDARRGSWPAAVYGAGGAG